MSYSKFMKEEYEAIDPEEAISDRINKVGEKIDEKGELTPKIEAEIEAISNDLNKEISSKKGNVEESLRKQRSRILRLKQWPDMYKKIKGNYTGESVTFRMYEQIHAKFETFSSDRGNAVNSYVGGLKKFFGGIDNRANLDTFRQDTANAFKRTYHEITGVVGFDGSMFGKDGVSRAKTANIILKEALEGMKNASLDSFDPNFVDQMKILESMTQVDDPTGTNINYDKVRSEINAATDADVEKVKKLIDDVNAAHDAFWNDSMLGSSLKYARKAFTELFKKLLQLVMFLAPYAIPAWLLYSFLRHAFSKCYWINSNPKCNFGDKQKFQTSKHTFSEGSDTFVQNLTFSTDNSKHCKCEDKIELKQLRQDPNSSLIPLHFEDTPTGGCDTGDARGMYCMAAKPNSNDPPGFDNKSIYPICLEQTEDGVKCNGRYKYYDCDLTEMLNEAADLFKRFINFNPMNLIKMILYGFIAIVLVYVAITVIRYVMAKNKE